MHNTIIFFLILISILVFWILSSVIINFNYIKNQIVAKYSNHGTLIELIWTITPALVLVCIAFPSFQLLYLIDEVISPSITIKAAGRQWYWTYEFSDFVNNDGSAIEYDSYIVPDTDLDIGIFRLLDVDNWVIVPIDTHIRFIITGQDVIHNFAVPGLGIRVDAVPGRLNQASIIIEREGRYYGQCSELCGVYHGFIPICIQAVNLQDFLIWLDEIV